MKIDSIEIFYVKNPMKAPFITACGAEPDIYSVLVKMQSGSSSGWGEASPFHAPTYSSEFAYGIYHLVSEFFAQAVVGREVNSAGELLHLLSHFRGNPFAKSAVELAWWTLESEMRQVPLHILLGGTDKEVEVGADFGVEDKIEVLLEKIQGAVDQGFKRVKIKVRPGWDLEIMREIRRTFPNHTFHIDCNSGYSLEDIPMFKEFDKLGLAMIEQPLFHSDLLDHAKLQAMLDTPICLDESLNSVKSAREAIELGACRWMNIKCGRVGGLKNSVEIHDMCKEVNIGCWVGGMLETSVGAGICLELATLSNFIYPSDIFPSSRFYAEEISQGRMELSSPGKMKPSGKCGSPFIPDAEILNKRKIAYTSIEC